MRLFSGTRRRARIVKGFYNFYTKVYGRPIGASFVMDMSTIARSLHLSCPAADVTGMQISDG